MNTTQRLFAAGLVLCALAACNRDKLDLPGTVQEADVDSTGRDAADPYVVSGNAGKVGAAIDANGAITEPKTVFARDEKVHLSMDAKGRRKGDLVQVYWFHADGISRKEEQKAVEGPFVAFEYVPTETGKYSIEIDVNERPIGLVDFEVK